MKKDYEHCKFEDNEMELFERIKMSLMLNELYDMYKDKNIIYKNNGEESYINSFQLRQISFAYIKVVLDALDYFKNDERYLNYISNLNNIMNANVGNKTFSKIIKDFRDKTFHPQKKSFINTRELYIAYFDNIQVNYEQIIIILEQIYNDFICDKEKMLGSIFKFYESKFYLKIKEESEKND